MKTVSITAHMPNIHDGTSWYRAAGPLAALRKADRDVNWQVQTVSEFSAPVAMLTDVAFFQRPSTPNELQAMRIFKRLGVPVVVDYDDLLFDVPKDNPAHRIYMTKETQTTVISCMQEADAIIVSTKELKRCLQLKKNPLNARVYVVPNALDDLHLLRGARTKPPVSKNNTVMWRGSPTHERDLMEYAEPIIDAARDYPKTSFTFVGWNPWWLSERMGQTQAIISSPLPVGEFMDFIYATAPAVGFVPLHKSRFNFCKSNIAWLELTWAGAVCLVPQWEEWINPGAVTYTNEETFHDGLQKIMAMDPAERDKVNAMAFDWIWKHRRLTQVNQLRRRILSAAAGHMPWPGGGDPIPEFYLTDDETSMELE